MKKRAPKERAPEERPQKKRATARKLCCEQLDACAQFEKADQEPVKMDQEAAPPFVDTPTDAALEEELKNPGSPTMAVATVAAKSAATNDDERLVNAMEENQD